MTTYYVRSTTGSNLNTGLTWLLAKADLAGAAAVAVAGDTVYVSQVHAESTAGAMSANFAGTLAAPITVICANDGAQPPTATATTATVTVTGNNPITIQTSGVGFFYGISFIGGNTGGGNSISIAANSGGVGVFASCSFQTPSPSNGAVIVAGGSTSSAVSWINTTTKFGATGQSILTSGRFSWNGGGVLAGGTSPAALLVESAAGASSLANVDASGVTLTNLYSSQNRFEQSRFCNVSATSNALVPSYLSWTSGINSGAAPGDFKFRWTHVYGETVDDETVVRTGGASDGTTPISWKLVTNANSKWPMPFEASPIAIWNNTAGANVTVTVFGIWGGASVPNNDDIWIELSYYGAAGSSLGTLNAANTKATILSANAPQGSDTSTWSGGILTPFKMSVTLSTPQPAQVGPIYVTIKAAKPSTTFYVDPKVVLS